MKGSESVAEGLLRAAHQDARAVSALAPLPDIADWIVGFHAQQAVEKALKAVLAHARVAFRRTHDIAELLDLLTDSGLALPPDADWLDELNPFAVESRYGLVDPGPLDRANLGPRITAVLAWAGTALDAR